VSRSCSTDRATHVLRRGRYVIIGTSVALATTLFGASGATAQPTDTTVSTTAAPTTSTTTLAATTTGSPTSTGAAASTTTGQTSTTSTAVATSTTVGQPTTTVVGTPTTATPTTLAPTTTTTIFKPGPTLKRGSKGDAVFALELRLDGLRYDVGDVDGKYDLQTWQGVMAFQKVNGLKRTGTYGPETQQALATATSPSGLLPNGGAPRVEIDIGRQVLMYFNEYGLVQVSAVSTGNGKKYCDTSGLTKRQVCGTARTPRGNFRVQRRIKGDRESDLGHLYNPVYFSGGFAVHGSPSVPAYAASHGCVRVTNKTADWFFENVKNGTPVYLYD
jgi:lipoprotein-anchoring transpeptidase ErfK/SrfK